MLDRIQVHPLTSDQNHTRTRKLDSSDVLTIGNRILGLESTETSVDEGVLHPPHFHICAQTIQGREKN